MLREKLLQSAKNLSESRFKLPRKDRKRLFSNWSVIEKKCTENLKMWLMTVQQTVNILLDKSKIADNDPLNLDNQ
jgi:hypothetical protein